MLSPRKTVLRIHSTRNHEALGLGVVVAGAIAGAYAGARLTGAPGAVTGALVGGVVGAFAVGRVHTVTFSVDGFGKLAVRCELHPSVANR